MPHRHRHPSDETLLRAVDGELSMRRGATVERHLVSCDGCRARLQRLASTAADVSREYRDQGALDAPWMDTSKARLAARMTELSAAWDRSWRFRAAQRLSAIPRAALAATVLAIVVIAARTVGPRPDSLQPDTLFTSTDALPIRSLTPGATEPVSVDQICAGRAPARQTVPPPVLQAILRDYRMEDVAPDQYELDYLITPELGGATDRRNLWPERYGSRVWNARVKDDLERLLPQLVCRGQLDLATAQHDIAADWIVAYKKYFHSDRPVGARTGRLTEDDASFVTATSVFVKSERDWGPVQHDSRGLLDRYR